MKCVPCVLIYLLLCAVQAAAQVAPHIYWVRLADKQQSPFRLEAPYAFLSQRCIERRLAQGIGFDELDLPVSPSYLAQLNGIEGARVLRASKWFNAALVHITDTTLEASVLATIDALPFVLERKSAQGTPNVQRPVLKELPEERVFYNYGEGTHQLTMIRGHKIHEMGYTGAGVHIAQFDAGWSRLDVLPAFERLRNEGRIAWMEDVVFQDNPNIYQYNTHGTSVLSIMASYVPDSLVGSAPDATYYLFRTENPLSEYVIEEDNWAIAAERCDSIGIDIINSSLGYTQFDDSTQNHTYADMNGKTCRSTIAADIASRKGILVVNSAGNSGAGNWRFLGAPSDGFEVMCLGAVRADSSKAGFSSFGPSADGRVKPNVVTMGQWTTFGAQDSTFRQGNGTSFSAPIMSGMAACLKQAFPDASVAELRTAIEQSAHMYNTPNDSLGYGIPNMEKAYEWLQQRRLQYAPPAGLNVFPNPTSDWLNVTLPMAEGTAVTFRIFDASGRLVHRSSAVSGGQLSDWQYASIAVNEWAAGLYTLQAEQGAQRYTARFQVVR